MRIPVMWALDSGDVGRRRSEATLVVFYSSQVAHMSQERVNKISGSIISFLAFLSCRIVDSAGCGQRFRFMWAGILVKWAAVPVMWGSRRLPHVLRHQGVVALACNHCCSMRVTFARSGSQ